MHLTQEDALRVAFPEPAEIERRTAFLSDADLGRARELAGEEVQIEGRVVTYYVGTLEGRPLGVAYFDAHRVRTLPEVLMIVVTPEARIERIEILAFKEPPEYLVPTSWLQQIVGRRLSDELSVKGSIVNMTGATLTSRAITGASRRVLALHQVIDPLDAAGPEGQEIRLEREGR
ncbi:MAG: FMN-binding protein [Gemmatimonadetes bacterium]|uniref:FMN-binding protein n=1 Tax=Candidatus Kutchimonas denitrificans TaxID=3056748 RepID=A0AAE5CBC2_9BACT|nr:FMN-binding protein [Gemmatimonadota bacterium]NIR74388.1 FMN-binding protein [Candidatus Kutchimonas denitrificans]NIS02639.1 FMN-binding protein [Gemmatimonadota bacterium]NIT68514.1 FMN-binding protein [Gemmatimonadota bacterium]NIU51991.1 FMN-binding protein [Gemmatimonadota bacterium]